MVTVVSVKFKGRGKTYYFDPGPLEIAEGEQVVVETSKGLEFCDCVQGNHVVTDERIVPPLRRVVRLATADDRRIAQLCKTREKEAFGICEKKIAAHGLEMKLVDVECAFDGSKMLFFFTSDGRVDFRELVRDLAGVFRTRIELRQIGVRDEAKMLGGIGMCGRPFCCSQFLNEFQPVSTKMAKVQSLSLNPTKISGCCGRLMCCLRYEQEAYESLVKTVPKLGAFVETAEGYGNVTQVNLLRQSVKVRLDGGDAQPTFPADEVAVIPGGRPKPGEALPHILELKPRPKPEPEELPRDYWIAPPVFAEDTMEPEKLSEGEKRAKNRRGKRGPGKPGKKPEQPPQQEAQLPIPFKGEEGQKRNRNRGRNGRGGGKPQNQEPQRKPQSAAPEKRAEARPQPKNPAGAGEGQNKKPNLRHRPRNRGSRPKPPAEG
ncbi:MAG: hypothetical protein K5990_08195 [Oscillospiraceae bacterium]|nr:hypothetical protein [Oscillospiraceae bacterium]